MAHVQLNASQHKLVLTQANPVSVEIYKGVNRERPDMTNTWRGGYHNSKPSDRSSSAWLLLCSCLCTAIAFYAEKNYVFMIPTHGARDAINIRATTHRSIGYHILPLHCLTGCDSVSSIIGVGKKKAMTVLRKRYSSSCFRRWNGWYWYHIDTTGSEIHCWMLWKQRKGIHIKCKV